MEGKRGERQLKKINTIMKGNDLSNDRGKRSKKQKIHYENYREALITLTSFFLLSFISSVSLLP